MAQRPGFVIPHDIYLEDGSKMTLEEKAAMYDALNLYSIKGEIPQFSDRYMMAIFHRYKASIDAGANKYRRTCEQLEEARKHRKDALNQSDTVLNQTEPVLNKIKSNQSKVTDDEPDSMRWWD